MKLKNVNALTLTASMVASMTACGRSRQKKQQLQQQKQQKQLMVQQKQPEQKAAN